MECLLYFIPFKRKTLPVLPLLIYYNQFSIIVNVVEHNTTRYSLFHYTITIYYSTLHCCRFHHSSSLRMLTLVLRSNGDFATLSTTCAPRPCLTVARRNTATGIPLPFSCPWFGFLFIRTSWFGWSPLSVRVKGGDILIHRKYITF